MAEHHSNPLPAGLGSELLPEHMEAFHKHLFAAQTALALDLLQLNLLPSIIAACVALWYLWRKGVCQHPISTQQNQHNLSQWIIPTLLPSVSHAGLLQHPIYIFIGQLSPPLRGVSGSRAFSNGGIAAIL